MGSIVLATDGSEYAREAASRAVELAADRAVPLYAICVVDQRRFNDPALSSTELATIYAEEHAAMCISEVAEMGESYDVDVSGVVRHGIPEKVILDFASEVDAEVIVIGEHGDHDEHLAGVGERVADRSDREVVIVDEGRERRPVRRA